MEEDVMKDKWRYTFQPEWALDKLAGSHNPEDEMIARIDGEVEVDKYSFDGYEILKKLTPKEAIVVQSICYDGLTFEKTGKLMRLSKQRVHQIYTGALKKLKGEISEDRTL